MKTHSELFDRQLGQNRKFNSHENKNLYLTFLRKTGEIYPKEVYVTKSTLIILSKGVQSVRIGI